MHHVSDKTKGSPLQVLGARGEQMVAQWLEAKGFEIVARNYSCRSGEIDIIALKGEILAFVEVKLRNSSYFNLSEVVGPAKQRKIISAAKLFLLHNRYREHVYRFDIALLEPKEDRFALTYLPNAFSEPAYCG